MTLTFQEPKLFIGRAGWAIERRQAALFPAAGTHLERYAAVFGAVEINSSFYRPHRRATYERWAQSVPAAFRFAVKLPRAITHECGLQDADLLLARFLDEVAGLDAKLGPLLVQLPPALELEARVAERFFRALRARCAGTLVCEPRHPSWFTPGGDALLREHAVARVAADPALAAGGGEPGGALEHAYLRLHGAPRIYWSAYERPALERFACVLHQAAARARELWCIFDNTALGAATTDALALDALVRGATPRDAGAADRR